MAFLIVLAVVLGFGYSKARGWRIVYVLLPLAFAIYWLACRVDVPMGATGPCSASLLLEGLS